MRTISEEGYRIAIRALATASDKLDKAHAEAVKARKLEGACAEDYQKKLAVVVRSSAVEKTYIVELDTSRTAVTVRHDDEHNGFAVNVLSIEEA